jgi:hypothetical protein
MLENLSHLGQKKGRMKTLIQVEHRFMTEALLGFVLVVIFQGMFKGAEA